MRLIDLGLDKLREASWNPNVVDESTLGRLRESIARYGLIQNLVVRRLGSSYEVLSGNQRLQVLIEMAVDTVPCVVVEVDDANARLLAQAFNRIHGEDDLGLKAELLRQVIEEIPQEAVLALLPETSESLNALSTLGEQDIADYLAGWQEARASRLKHMQFQLTSDQMEVVEQALHGVTDQARDLLATNPNTRGNALFLICRRFLELEVGL